MSAQSSKTFVEALDALASITDRGFRFVGSDGKERYFPYADMHRIALERAQVFVDKGLVKGDRLALVISEGHEFVLSFLGAVMAGVVPVPIFPRASFKGIESYTDTVAHIVSTARAKALLTMHNTFEFVAPVRDRNVGLEEVWTTETLFMGSAKPLGLDARPSVSPSDTVFLQFTSGSTSQPKGVIVTHENLIANASSFLGPQGARRQPSDIGVSWLPLYHDMGLIGFVLGTLIMDIPVILLPTASFARAPRLWLETIQKYKATITYAPNFAYGLIVKRLKDKDIETLDLSSLRLAGCGAEPIRAQTLRDFASRLAPTGFRAEAFLPSYGMAESTLAITFHNVGTPMIVDRVDADALKEGRAVAVAVNPNDHQATSSAVEIVSCGKPFPGHEIRIVTEDGRECGSREVGEVVARGPSVSPGYFENTEATQAALRGGWLYTGDLGYIADGNLYICGRLKDLIIIKGANYYPQDIEWAVGDLPGVRRGHVVAFSVSVEGEEHLIVTAEAASMDAESLRQSVPPRVYEATGLTVQKVVVVPIGALPQTSSGKPQRRKTKQMYESGTLAEHP